MVEFESMKNESPMFGRYVKLLKTGEILKWNSFEPKTKQVEIEWSTGAVHTVNQLEIARLTADEEIEFLRGLGKGSIQ